jgi:hypothetical protein
MSFWNGTQWVHAEPDRAPTRSRLARWPATFVMVLGLVALIVPFSPIAAASHKADPGCSVSPSAPTVGSTYTVAAWGLPTGRALNLWVTDPAGTVTGTPIGSTSDGTFTINGSAPSAGTWTYTFKGADKNNPATTPVYATCSVDAY